MRALALGAVVLLVGGGSAFAQEFAGDADAAADQGAAAAGQAGRSAPDIGFRLVPTGVILRKPFRDTAFPAFGYGMLGRFSGFGGLGLRLLGKAAQGVAEFADDETGAGQFGNSGRQAFGVPAGGDAERAYRGMGGIAADWRYQWSPTGQFSLAVQQARVRTFQDALRNYEGSEFLAGAGWLQALGAERRGEVYAGVYGGQYRAADSRIEGDRTFGGMRILARWGASEHADLFAFANAANGRYERSNAGLAPQRRDLQYDAGIGLNWRVDANWSVRPQFTFTRNDSNIEVYDYNRYDLSVTLRRDFR